MRIAVVEYDKCKPKKCSYECKTFCPGVRMGEETVVISDDNKKPIISETLCSGCGICIHKCPFGAIHIINLPEELEEPVHQFGPNSFRLYRLPIPKENSVLGIIGPNGVGKTTAIKILSGEIVPNLGNYDEFSSLLGTFSQHTISQEERARQYDIIARYFRGSELQPYFEKLQEGELKVVSKPQYVDKIPKVVSGTVEEVINKVDERNMADGLFDEFGMEEVRERTLEDLSGGELQRLAIMAAIVRDADVYYFDEPSSYLDIYQRLNVARVIRRLSKDKTVIVIEHDLAVLDYLSDHVHLIYGRPAVYGIVSSPMGVRVGINTYLQGFLKDENVRFRNEEIKFTYKSPKEWSSEDVLFAYPELTKDFPTFSLSVSPGEVYKGEVVSIVGPNATGKSTFIKMIAGVEELTSGDLSRELEVSYKPQYIKRDFDGTVRELLFAVAKSTLYESWYKTEILSPLQLTMLLDNRVDELSGGELQRTAIAACLSKKADLYLLDEPSAYLDVEQRLAMAKTIRRRMENEESTAIVVEHDLVTTDYISDRTIVFSGTPSVDGSASSPVMMRKGMNDFLSRIDITFRRDSENGRPRANKRDSQLDRKQKDMGEYYYSQFK
ncbi:MAG TPA: ribosome biogenesis/translation initiation ATPase RLI [Methanomicrobia archaeon]|nr:ribosome biogenesis/translation initiation ATPase RLI [Methanomicrobia archaeon]